MCCVVEHVLDGTVALYILTEHNPPPSLDEAFTTSLTSLI